jgi:uncharacterized protein (TIGR02594 family)
MPSFADIESDYESLWAGMTIRRERAEAVTLVARKLIANKARYQAVAAKTRVPWFVIAALHNRESNADFSTYLGNGEPLNRVTRIVPKGRGPFTSWEAGAIDALALDGLDQVAVAVAAWTPQRACYEIEKFNGFGYRTHHPAVKSPYLWSFSNQYSCGKYVADGRFDAGAVDAQCGAIPIIRRIMELDATARFGAGPPASLQQPPPPQQQQASGWLARLLAALLGAFRRKPDPKPGPTSPPAPAPIPPKVPPWVSWALGELGFHERPGNQGIEKYIALAHCGSAGDPWCAIFANAGLEASGIRGTRSAMARSFEHSGNFTKLAGPAYGAITTMWRGSPQAGTGHVFYYVGENRNGVLALGGNQSDEVCRQYEPRSRIVGYFWPVSQPLPKVGAIVIDDDEAEEIGEGSET